MTDAAQSNALVLAVLPLLESKLFAAAQELARSVRLIGQMSDEDASKAVTCALLSSALNFWCSEATAKGRVTFAQAQQQVLNAAIDIAREGAKSRRALGLPVDEVIQ